MLLPHHDGSVLFVDQQAPNLGETVQVRVRIPHAFGAIAAVRTRSNPDHEPRFTDAVHVATTPGWDWWQAPVTVENPVHGYRFMITRGDGSTVYLNATGVHSIETLDSEDFTIVTFDQAPEWVRSSVLYQIFPDRFARSGQADERAAPEWAIPATWDEPVDVVPPGRSQQFYGGDLDGIIEHLDHVVALGVTVIYLTPVFPGHSNHRYDASSFDAVDPLLGGDAALVHLVEEAHSRGLTVIGDLTTNHCGNGHEWFQAAYGNPDAPESEFFYWLNEKHTEYESWLGVPSLPKFNWNSAELRRRFIEGGDSVVARWLKAPYSFDGWRIDVANMTGRYRDQDLNTEVRRTIRRTMCEINPDTILLAESTNDPTGDFLGDAWHGAMTYTNFTRPVWGWLSRPGSPSSYFGQPVGTIPSYTGHELYAAHTQFTAGFPWRTRLGTMNALDTHDVPRFRTHAMPGTVPVALGMSVTLPGIPVVWAGDEFGLVGEDGEASRTPLPWSLLQGKSGPSHLPDPETAREATNLYSTLIRVRREHPALNHGGMRWLHVSDDVLAYVREAAQESVLVVASRADHDVTLSVDAVDATTHTRIYGHDVLSAHGQGIPSDETNGIRIAGSGPSFSAWVLPGVDLSEDRLQ